DCQYGRTIGENRHGTLPILGMSPISSDVRRFPPPGDVQAWQPASSCDRLSDMQRHHVQTSTANRGSELRVVVIGEGTGIYAVLTGLRDHTSNITAVVSMSDN